MRPTLPNDGRVGLNRLRRYLTPRYDGPMIDYDYDEPESEPEPAPDPYSYYCDFCGQEHRGDIC